MVREKADMGLSSYKSVLVVEDDWVDIEMMQRSLERVYPGSLMATCQSIAEMFVYLDAVIFDAIIVGTYRNEGTMQDVLKAMSDRGITAPIYLRPGATDTLHLDLACAFGVCGIESKTWSATQLDAFWQRILEDVSPLERRSAEGCVGEQCDVCVSYQSWRTSHPHGC